MLTIILAALSLLIIIAWIADAHARRTAWRNIALARQRRANGPTARRRGGRTPTP